MRVCEKAKPASSEANDRADRASALAGSQSATGNQASTLRAAETASTSLNGLACRFQIASRAWDSASNPVSRVTAAGQLCVRVGSTKAQSAKPKASSKERFWAGSKSVSQTVAQRVTSLPVPAVVGTIHSGARSSAGQGAVPRSA